MPRGRPSPKLAISIDSEIHRRVIAAAASAGISVSAWMTSAARSALIVEDGLAAVAEWETEHGAFTDDEMEAAHGRIRSELETGSGHGRRL